MGVRDSPGCIAGGTRGQDRAYTADVEAGARAVGRSPVPVAGARLRSPSESSYPARQRWHRWGAISSGPGTPSSCRTHLPARRPACRRAPSTPGLSIWSSQFADSRSARAFDKLPPSASPGAAGRTGGRNEAPSVPELDDAGFSRLATLLKATPASDLRTKQWHGQPSAHRRMAISGHDGLDKYLSTSCGDPSEQKSLIRDSLHQRHDFVAMPALRPGAHLVVEPLVDAA